jgi:putative intracellular protease/amidase
MNAKEQHLNIGAVIFPDFELLDIYGPLEILGALRERVTITMLAEKIGKVKSHQGPTSIADASINDASGFDLLIIPGGWGTRTEVNNTSFLKAVLEKANEARWVASICTGSALLAKTGILDGMKATTNKQAFDWVASQGQNVKWIREARWVEDGKFFTSSGVSAGMDMTLGIIQEIFNRELSLQVARYTEYIWNEDKSVDPFALPIEE